MAQDMQDNDYELDEEVIVLENEDGEEVKFQHIATIDYQDEWYIFLQPVELGDLEEDEVLISASIPTKTATICTSRLKTKR